MEVIRTALKRNIIKGWRLAWENKYTQQVTDSNQNNTYKDTTVILTVIKWKRNYWSAASVRILICLTAGLIICINYEI